MKKWKKLKHVQNVEARWNREDFILFISRRLSLLENRERRKKGILTYGPEDKKEIIAYACKNCGYIELYIKK
ncbi:hypothetical protein J7L00_05360 [Candidatus Bathyarchaeota archaeon]|nr:hypothetical protein [Candidatus Bathyarchaeota archaeon]